MYTKSLRISFSFICCLIFTSAAYAQTISSEENIAQSHGAIAQIIFGYKLINYYTAAIHRKSFFSSPYWDQPEPDSELTIDKILEHDFKKIASLNANAIRVGINSDDIGLRRGSG